MTEAFEPYAPPKANLARPGSPEPMLLTPEGLPRLRSLLKAALKVWRAEPGTLAVIILVTHLPISLFVKAFFGFPSLWSYWGLLGIELLVGLLGWLALARLVEGVRKGAPPSLGKCLGVAVSRWLPAIGAQILLSLSVFVGFLIFIVPGIYIAVATAFSIVLVALRQASPTDALEDSSELIRGRWWPTFRLFVLLVLCQIGIAIVLVAPSAFLPDHPILLAAEGLIMDFVTAFFFIALVILFLELEAQRKDASENPDRLPIEPDDGRLRLNPAGSH